MSEDLSGSSRVVPVKVIAKRISEILGSSGGSVEEACWAFVNEPPDDPLKRLMRGTWDARGRELLIGWYYEGAKFDLTEPDSNESA